MTIPSGPYRTVRDLIHCHAGAPAVVIGGGESAPASFQQCPPDAVRISANEHGFKLASCSYVVALDKIEARLRPLGAPIVSRHVWADFRLLEWPAPNSGIAAACVARLMGCDPIWLIGMDCFKGGTYFHDRDAKSSGRNTKPQDHLANWRHFFTRFAGPYRPLGGMLQQFFERTEDRFARPAPAREQLLAEVRGVRVEFRRDYLFQALGCARDMRRGDALEVRREEAQKLTKLRVAAPVALAA